MKIFLFVKGYGCNKNSLQKPWPVKKQKVWQQRLQLDPTFLYAWLFPFAKFEKYRMIHTNFTDDKLHSFAFSRNEIQGDEINTNRRGLFYLTTLRI